MAGDVGQRLPGGAAGDQISKAGQLLESQWALWLSQDRRPVQVKDVGQQQLGVEPGLAGLRLDSGVLEGLDGLSQGGLEVDRHSLYATACSRSA